METKDVYLEHAKAKLNQWNAQIRYLQAKAANAQADVQAAMQHQIDELATRRDAVSEKIDRLRNTSSEAWQDVRTGFDQASTTLEDALKTALSRFS